MIVCREKTNFLGRLFVYTCLHVATTLLVALGLSTYFCDYFTGILAFGFGYISWISDVTRLKLLQYSLLYLAMETMCSNVQLLYEKTAVLCKSYTQTTSDNGSGANTRNYCAASTGWHFR